MRDQGCLEVVEALAVDREPANLVSCCADDRGPVDRNGRQFIVQELLKISVDLLAGGLVRRPHHSGSAILDFLHEIRV